MIIVETYVRLKELASTGHMGGTDERSGGQLEGSANFWHTEAARGDTFEGEDGS